MSYKDIWLVRHTETETPESYDFNLSRTGKRNAQILGWHMAQQELLLPAVFIYGATSRANSMVENLKISLRHLDDKSFLHADPGGIPLHPARGLVELWKTTVELDRLASHFGGQSPNSAVYIVHRQYQDAFDLLRVLMTKQQVENLENLPENKNNKATARQFLRGYNHGQCVRIRMPSPSWNDIEYASGEILSDVCPRDIKDGYKAWRRERRLAL